MGYGVPVVGVRKRRSYLRGRLRAWSTPRVTQSVNCRLVLTPSASTRIHPRTSRPAITIGLTWARPRSLSVSSGGTRTIRPPCPLTATDMLPLTRNARPPNIRFSSTPRSGPSSSRMRSARSASYAIRLPGVRHAFGSGRQAAVDKDQFEFGGPEATLPHLLICVAAVPTPGNVHGWKFEQDNAFRIRVSFEQLERSVC